MGQTYTIKARLLSKRQSEYTAYAFQNLDVEHEYVLCTLLPNWENGLVNEGQEGILTYRKIVAGEIWVCPKTYVENKYSYSAIYFEDFVPLTHIVDGNRIQEIGTIYVS